MNQVKSRAYVSKCVITGASSGIGRAISMRLREEGYVVAELQRTNANIPTNLANYDSIPEVWQATLSHLGAAPDLVILNAGRSLDCSFAEMLAADMLEVFELNVFGTLIMAREAISTWIRLKKKGHLIFIGSQAALPGAKQTGNVLYTASKGAIHSIIGPLANEYGPDIRINCIAPGDVNTDAELALLKTKAAQLSVSFDDVFRDVEEEAPLKRWVYPDEISEVVMFLERCEAMTGATINISAGKTAY